jgi:hypothetical protein
VTFTVLKQGGKLTQKAVEKGFKKSLTIEAQDSLYGRFVAFRESDGPDGKLFVD